MNDLEPVWQEIAAEASLLARHDEFPIWTDNGTWVTVPFDVDERGILPHHGSWMVGDLPAMLWFLASGDPDAARRPGWQDAAQTWSDRLANRTGTRTFASVSHMFFRGALTGMSIGDAESLRPMALAAAETISTRLLEIGYMKSFGPPGDSSYPFTTVDDVINLTIPLWYANATGDERLREAAIRAIDEIVDGLIRPDGSTGQVLQIDEHGRPGAVETYQGFSADGCWSRGQAWGIYGFATVFAQTHETRFLEVAKAMADYWVDRVQDDPSPIWDFALPAGERVIRDTFAGSLAYAGILELASSLPPAQASALRDYANDMVLRMAKAYVQGRPRGSGLLADAALDVPHRHGIGSSVIVGDSYFTEAVWRLSQADRRGAGCLVPR